MRIFDQVSFLLQENAKIERQKEEIKSQRRNTFDYFFFLNSNNNNNHDESSGKNEKEQAQLQMDLEKKKIY